MPSRTTSSPAWTGRLMCSHTLGSSATASMMRWLMNMGCDVRKRMRSSPGVSWMAWRRSGQIGLFGQVLAVRVDRLAQEGHLPHAPRRQQLDLARQLRDGNAHLPPAAVRDDAEGAEEVAAMDDGHVACDVRLRRKQRANAPLPVHAVALSHQVQQGPVLLGRHEHVHEGEAVLQLPALRADHAPHESQQLAGAAPLHGLHHPQVPHHLVLGALADHTGVEAPPRRRHRGTAPPGNPTDPARPPAAPSPPCSSDNQWSRCDSWASCSPRRRIALAASQEERHRLVWHLCLFARLWRRDRDSNPGGAFQPPSA